jgi:anti-anti-sigma regulatory factor
MDSAGVRLIIEAHARSRADGDRLVLTCGPGPIQRLFELTDLTERLPFID